MMDDDTKARLRASDENTAGIIAGRRRAAQALLATDPEPAREVRDNWDAVRHMGRRSDFHPSEYQDGP